MGTHVPIRCPPGSFCPPESEAPIPCAAGTFMNAPAASACQPCRLNLGDYCPTNSTARGSCPAAFWCPTPDTIVACQRNYFCPERSTNQQRCTVCTTGTVSPCNSTQDTICVGSCNCDNVFSCNLGPFVGPLTGLLISLASALVYKSLKDFT